MRSDPIPSQKQRARADTAGEADVWWGGYAGRTMLASFLGCVVLTATLAVAAFRARARLEAQGFSPDEAAALVRYPFYALAGTLWLVQVGLWLHRSVAITYRLTNRHLYVDWGFLYTSFHVIPLASIVTVQLQQDPMARWLNVGRVRITTAGPDRRTVVLIGVDEPARLAAAINRAQQRAVGTPG